MWSQELDLMVFAGPFQLGIFCGSMKVKQQKKNNKGKNKRNGGPANIV